MPVSNVTTGDPITEAWGDAVADSVNDLEAVAPTTDEKAALAGTSGAPATGNKYVTDADPRNTNSRSPSDHTHAASGGGGGGALAPTSLILPGAVGPSPTTEGQAQWDTAQSYIVVGTGAGTAYFFQVAGTPSDQAIGDAAAAGSASSVSRSDHKHGMPAFGSPVAIGYANAAGSAVTLPRSDHVHAGEWDGVVTKTALESVASSVAVQNDDELFISLDSGVWEIEIALIYDGGASAADLKVDLGCDALNRGVFRWSGRSTADAAAQGVLFANQTATATFGNPGGAGTGSIRAALFRGDFTVDAGEANQTFRVRWAQNTSNATAIRVREGSRIRYRKLLDL